jgi:hypothetical protein
MENLLTAAKAQPPGIDIRDQREFMFSHAQSMKELNYISKNPDKDFVNFQLLEHVTRESPQLCRAARRICRGHRPQWLREEHLAHDVGRPRDADLRDHYLR